ncbi:MAG: hypothetical protein ABI970_20345 [Chloroflexota bacterium]
MSLVEDREQIRQAVTFIKAGDMQAAREILRPLCQGGSADAWWLLAKTTQDQKSIRYALQKALAINPQHERATLQFAQLFPDVDPSDVVEPVIRKAKEKEKEKGNPAEAHRARLIIIGLAGVVIGLLVIFVFRSVTYTLPPPVLGPYYQRYGLEYAGLTPSPCKKFTLFGQVKDAPAGMVVHAWIRDFDQQAITDNQGNFRITLPKEAIVYPDNKNFQYINDVPVNLQLLDTTGKVQSGITHNVFFNGCVSYHEFWHENSGGYKFGDPALRPPSWNGPYSVSYSPLTTTPLLTCDFTGFTGTAYDDNGPMKDLTVQITNSEFGSGKPVYNRTLTSGLEIPMGPGWWYIKVEPEHTYLIQVINHEGIVIFADFVYLPKKQGCGANLIEMSIMQADTREDSVLPPLPEGWNS